MESFSCRLKLSAALTLQPEPRKNQIVMPIAKAGANFTPAPEGTHLARCFGCISLGTQKSELFAASWKILLMFELPEEMIEIPDKGAAPMVVTKEYTLSLGKKATLTQHLNSWRGRAFTPEELKGFEVSNVVGAACQVTIQHKAAKVTGNVRADIVSITGLPKGVTPPAQWHPSVKYEIEMMKNEVFTALPEWIQKKIALCEEWQPSTVKPIEAPEPPEQGPDAEDELVPF